MAGYYGFSKSNNAIAAEEMGKYPLSKIKKSHLEEYNISMSLSDAKLLAKHGYWKSSEWHHTSKEYNVTHYYDLEILKLIEEDEHEEYQAFLSKIKAEAKDGNKEDIFYAKIKVREYYRSGRRWVAEFNEVYAAIKNWHSSSSSYCSYNGNRKKKDNITILRTLTKEEYYAIEEQEEKERLIRSKRVKKALLKAKKAEILLKIDTYIEQDIKKDELEWLYKKIKNARKIESVEKYAVVFGEVEASYQEELSVIKLKALEKLREKIKEGIDLFEWVMLPQSVRHPAPKSVMDAKLESGLGWNAFERGLRKTIGGSNE